MPLGEVTNYVRSHYPPDYHFYATDFQIRYLAVSFLDREGLLYPSESERVRQHYFGKLYVAERGDALSATGRFLVNFVPGLSYFPYIF